MKRNMTISLAVLVLVSSGSAFAQSAPSLAQSGPWKALLGQWEGEGGGAPGQGNGWMSFAAELGGRLLVRKNHVEFPAEGGRPGSIHDDLLIVYQESTTALRADYFDNEGHIIRYQVSAAADGQKVVFVSPVSPSAPRYRMTTILLPDDRVRITFEVAPPGKPEGFTKYTDGLARRKK